MLDNLLSIAMSKYMSNTPVMEQAYQIGARKAAAQQAAQEAEDKHKQVGIELQTSTNALERRKQMQDIVQGASQKIQALRNEGKNAEADQLARSVQQQLAGLGSGNEAMAFGQTVKPPDQSQFNDPIRQMQQAWINQYGEEKAAQMMEKFQTGLRTIAASGKGSGVTINLPPQYDPNRTDRQYGTWTAKNVDPRDATAFNQSIETAANDMRAFAKTNKFEIDSNWANDAFFKLGQNSGKDGQKISGEGMLNMRDRFDQQYFNQYAGQLKQDTVRAAQLAANASPEERQKLIDYWNNSWGTFGITPPPFLGQ